ncbi:MAG TPA: sigma-70 family RNA polymerase sigma factor [Planctomycetota bacterium]|nr:sigma-70 family RNA polymerase sigma factor [Planctomycetota bacterium]
MSTSGPQPVAADAASTVSDGELLQSIGTRHCQKSFSELYQRYQHKAYSLAFALTNDHTTAEEIVQNGMLRLWQSAPSYQPDNPRAWILCVVAREGLKLLKKQRRERTKIMNATKNQSRAPLPGAEESTEHAEVLTALRKALLELPEHERHLVTLYFGAGLSQAEIARELDTPQQTISRHINDVVGRLKGTLRKAGFAGALPLLNAEKLSEAACSGCTAPSGLQQKVMLQASTHPLSTAAHVGTETGRMSSLSISVIAATVVISVGALWYAFSGPKQVAAPAVQPPKVAPLTPPLPSWGPLTDDFHEVLGTGKGKWTTQKTPSGLTLAFQPDGGKESLEPSYCYLGRNFSTSYELRGVLECGPQTPDTTIGAVFLICHPNRVNCTGYICGFKPSQAPIRFRMQVRFSQKGCEFALSVMNSAGQIQRTQPNDEWLQRPWSAPAQGWRQLSFAGMEQCGFGFEVRHPLKLSQLQTRPLLESEWLKDVESQR